MFKKFLGSIQHQASAVVEKVSNGIKEAIAAADSAEKLEKELGTKNVDWTLALRGLPIQSQMLNSKGLRTEFNIMCALRVPAVIAFFDPTFSPVLRDGFQPVRANAAKSNPLPSIFRCMNCPACIVALCGLKTAYACPRPDFNLPVLKDGFQPILISKLKSYSELPSLSQFGLIVQKNRNNIMSHVSLEAQPSALSHSTYALSLGRKVRFENSPLQLDTG